METMCTAALKQQIEQEFAAFEQRNPALAGELAGSLAGCLPAEQLVLKFYYSTMPYSDAVNYPLEIFLDYARHSIFLWQNSPFVKQIPPAIFWNYAVHYRVNAEEILPCRSEFYNRIKAQIKAESVTETVLAINYWCAGEVTYQTTDERSASALAVFRAGLGRCGEESVFAVQVLRSAGIPARQIYAPWWAHCDDNHAWVEVWIDGEWRFLGACEPEEVLDQGWFTGAASRAILVQSRVFLPCSWSNQPEHEPIISRQGCVTILNQTARYAKTARIDIRVRDQKGDWLAGAEIKLGIFNYAAFAESVTAATDRNGWYQIETGLGSIRIFACWQGLTAVRDITVTDHLEVILVLQRSVDSFKEKQPREFDCIASADGNPAVAVLSDRQQIWAQERLAESSAHLKKKEDDLAAQVFAADLGALFEEEENQQSAAAIAAVSRGNVLQLKAYLSGGDDVQERNLRLELLGILPDKDWRDVRSGVLEEHWQAAYQYRDRFDAPVFNAGIANPRIWWEPLYCWRAEILQMLSAEQIRRWQQAPEEAVEYVGKQIKECDQFDSPALVVRPDRCLKYGIGNRRSKAILTVALLRTIGVPARLNPVEGSIEYYRNGGYHSSGAVATSKCRLLLEFLPGVQWSYRENWSLARFDQQSNYFKQLELDKKAPDQGGQLVLGLLPGSYRLTTANRLPNGNVMAKEWDFVLEEQGAAIPVSLRRAAAADMFVEVPLPQFALLDQNNRCHTVSDFSTEICSLLVWLKEREEPTEHILNELYEHHQVFGQLPLQLILILPKPLQAFSPTLEKVRKVFPESQLWYAKDSKTAEKVARKMYVDPGKMPLLVLTDETGKGIYGTSGYNVGTGAMLIKLVQIWQTDKTGHEPEK